MKRSIITIDREKCTGCGECIPNCPEGALQIIDNKACLLSDLFCDGLGACIGHCPEGAITIEEREAEDYNERKVMSNVIRQGPNVIKAHLDHLKFHKQEDYVKQAEAYLKENNIEVPSEAKSVMHEHGEGCPGSRARSFSKPAAPENGMTSAQSSELRQWPVQMHLISPMAAYFQKSDVVLAADCVAYSLGNFHSAWLKGKSIAIACPKLDQGKEIYLEKLADLIDKALINTLTVMTMEVPCCSGLLRLARQAVEKASRKIPIKSVIVGIEGDILSEKWV
ncbi:MAG: 4Fe-4S binding protein [Chitinivibrionales bacterium]